MITKYKNWFWAHQKILETNNINILFNLALSLQSLGQIEEAKKNYLGLIKINPNDIRSYYALSVLNINNVCAKTINATSDIKFSGLVKFDEGLSIKSSS